MPPKYSMGGLRSCDGGRAVGKPGFATLIDVFAVLVDASQRFRNTPIPKTGF